MLEEYALLPRGENPPEPGWPAVPAHLRAGSLVAVCPPAHLTLTKHLEVPALTRGQRERLVRFEAAQAIPRPLAEVVWDWAPGADGATTVELAAMKLDGAEALCRDAEAAGVQLDAIVPRAVASARALRHSYPELGARAVLAEIDGSNALLVRGSAVRLIGLPERVPAAAGDPAGAAVERDGELRSRRLAAETLRLVGEGHDAGDAASPVVLLMAGSEAPALEEVERSLAGTAVRVERFDALRRVRLGTAASGAAALAHQFGVVVGAALAARERAPNLLPPARRRERLFRRRRGWWLGLAGAVAGALWLAVLGLRLEVGLKQAEVASLVREMEPWRAAGRMVEERQRELDACERELAVLRGLGRARTSWVEFLAETEARLAKVGGIWIETMRLQSAAENGPATGGLFGRGGAPGPRDGVARLRLAITGCALDPGLDDRRGLDRVQELLRDWPKAGGVAAVESERFDASEPGLLRFGCVLVLQPEAGL